MNKRRLPATGRSAIFAGILSWATAGCSTQYRTDQFVEDGPSSEQLWNSPTAADVRQRFTEAPQRVRDFPAQTLTTADGTTPHWPLYFEDPFVDKGTGRVDEDPDGFTAHGRNKYRLGATDIVAGLYVLPRFWMNTLLLPASLIVQHPFTEMESDGRLSRQALGYDHDATNASPETHDRALNDLAPRLQSQPDNGNHDPHSAQKRGP